MFGRRTGDATCRVVEAQALDDVGTSCVSASSACIIGTSGKSERSSQADVSRRSHAPLEPIRSRWRTGDPIPRPTRNASDMSAREPRIEVRPRLQPSHHPRTPSRPGRNYKSRVPRWQRGLPWSSSWRSMETTMATPPVERRYRKQTDFPPGRHEDKIFPAPIILR